ncbi:tigger transposable element-derived protein 6 [Trichonephila clavipes]|nr:tigger transposable element-derived protein 6 [Trichonephila clavipes]
MCLAAFHDSSNSCSKRLRTSVYEDVDETVLVWIHNAKNKIVPISGSYVLKKASQFDEELGYDQFLFSNGGQEKFKQRHGKIRLKGFVVHCNDVL